MWVVRLTRSARPLLSSLHLSALLTSARSLVYITPGLRIVPAAQPQRNYQRFPILRKSYELWRDSLPWRKLIKCVVHTGVETALQTPLS